MQDLAKSSHTVKECRWAVREKIEEEGPLAEDDTNQSSEGRGPSFFWMRNDRISDPAVWRATEEPFRA